MYVHELVLRVRNLEQRIAAAGHLAQAWTNRENDIGLAYVLLQLWADRDAHFSGIERIAIVDQVLSPERTGHGQIEVLRKARDVCTCSCAPVASPEEHEGPGGGLEQVRHGTQVAVSGVGLDARIGTCGRRRSARHQHVFRQCEHDRTRSSRHCEVKRMAQILGDAIRTVDLGYPFRHLTEHAAIVYLLKSLALDHVGTDLSDEQNHR